MGSTFLFAMPSVIAGVGRAIDIGGVFDSYNESWTPEQADTIAAYLDWASIGADLSRAMKTFDASDRATLEPTQLAIPLG